MPPTPRYTTPQSLPRACSEAECLNLNVETTGYQQEEGKPLKPVMVYIHGGAFYLVRLGMSRGMALS